MKLFINDIKINIKKEACTVKTGKFDHFFSTFDKINVLELKGTILLAFPSPSIARVIFDQLEIGYSEVKKVTIITANPKEFMQQAFKDFSFIDAGGGIVKNAEGKFLMIFRNGIWDFPKGKLDKGEKIIDCAEREVEEECGVKIKAKSLICKTRHTYLGTKKKVLKTTYWYKMDLISDAKMKPQLNEGIEKVEWKSAEEVDQLLGESFASLRYLFEKAISSKSVSL
jgi:8-oxo-(d)GTP phosphatase